MTIDRILYINLKRRTDRRKWFEKEMKSRGVPMEIVKRIPAQDWRDYSDCEHIITAMHDDGFAPFVTPSKWKNKHHLRGHFCYVWSYSIALREITESDRSTLILHDDAVLAITWDELLERLASLPSDPSKLSVCQLEWFLHDNRRNPVNAYSKDPRWSHGIRSEGETAIIFNKFGAKRMLGLIQGCIDELNSVEIMIVSHFNNQYVFHSTTSKIIEQKPRTHTNSDSDIDPRKNPDMW